MNLLVVGAAGRTGGLVVDRALRDGHTVTALARDPGKAPSPRPGLTAVRADVLDPAGLTVPMKGQHAVVVALGVHGRGSTTVFSEGVRQVVAAARAAGTTRLVAMSSAGLSTGHLPFVQRQVTRLVAERVYGGIHTDLARMEAVVLDSGLDWTLVRAPMLRDGGPTSSYQVSVGGHVPTARAAVRADIADWIVRNLDEPATYRQHVEIAG
ncbi:NAD(P)-dependent oxidoreductase [Actinacidiphila paucisporea]|uniref:Putative NADH-flavin reductase n=1 Tax=Actinacidiphila paucisporea TaxID=310782 RepID=A0A1M7QVZ8_9ACTN|nr:NAD(P)H-binding protein [Actinacidiphila paucisporea]SHN36008.1 Putative NADH-flavin reductase [Actinacidiphila paucisporea]